MLIPRGISVCKGSVQLSNQCMLAAGVCLMGTLSEMRADKATSFQHTFEILEQCKQTLFRT